MDVINLSSFTVVYLPGRICFPGYSLSLIVKGTFDLFPDHQALPADQQLYPTGDEFYEDDENMQGGPRYPSDFAYFKPNADLCLVGKCCAPLGRSTPLQDCTFKVGSHSRTLTVIGDRYWKRKLFGYTPSEPQPFTEMELRYERSFGGYGYPRNPIGQGYSKPGKKLKTQVQKLPNIVDPNDRAGSPDSLAGPAGFGPLNMTWQQRQSRLGSFDADSLKNRWPWFPENLDWNFFNAAPRELQVRGYLRGDEALYCENLHPTYSHYHSLLPGSKTRCFVNKNCSHDHSSVEFTEIPMELDTLWVDMDNEKLVLVWRGWCEVESEDLEDVKHLLVISEPLGEPSMSIDQCRELFVQALYGRDTEAEGPAGTDQEIETTLGGGGEDDFEADMARFEDQSRATLLADGFDPDNPPSPSEEERRKEQLLLKELGLETDNAEQAAMSREMIIDLFEGQQSCAEKDFSLLDVSGLSLEGIDLTKSILTGANLQGANLSRATLSGATLVRANLSSSNLQGADLREADLTEANLENADLTGSVLDDAIVENALLRNCIGLQIKAERSYFAGSDLGGAQFSKSWLSRADFSHCTLHDASFENAELSEATLEGAQGHRINMQKANLTALRASEGCDFSNGSFKAASAPESIWEEANLTECDLTCTSMQSADFSKACLQKSDLSAADLKFSNFTKADLQSAALIEANLFQCTFEKTDLGKTDFRGSNLYGAEFLDALFKETNVQDSNIKMTKLEKK